MQRDVRIRGETINLGQLLKLEGVIGSGAEVKTFLSTEPVWVNGEPEARRGRKLHHDDVVRVGELELRVTSGRSVKRSFERPSWWTSERGPVSVLLASPVGRCGDRLRRRELFRCPGVAGFPLWRASGACA